MSKGFREWNLEQPVMFPATVLDYVPAEHIAHFVRNLVMELDLSEIVSRYEEARGNPPYHPVMMTCLLVYAYCQGIYSSRVIARACLQRVDFMAVTARQVPDYRTISDFRKSHLKALNGLFEQVLELCRVAGLVKLGHVALDGTRVRGNAAKDRTLTYEGLKKSESELSAEVKEWLQKAKEIDEAEDAEYGVERSGDELPEWVADKQKRIEKLRQAKAELEARAKAAAEQKQKEQEQKRTGKNGEPISSTPDKQAKINLTDADSRFMKTAQGFIQGYNAQAAVDADSQVIVAQVVTNEVVDVGQLIPMIEQIEMNTSDVMREISADTGYYSESNLEQLQERAVRGYIGTGRRDKNGRWHGNVGKLGKQMRARIDRGKHQSRYRLRAQTVEPVFGIIKAARGFRQFLLRGIKQVAGEWSLLCTAHNILKLAARRA
jgi:transposase